MIEYHFSDLIVGRDGVSPIIQTDDIHTGLFHLAEKVVNLQTNKVLKDRTKGEGEGMNKWINKVLALEYQWQEHSRAVNELVPSTEPVSQEQISIQRIRNTAKDLADALIAHFRAGFAFPEEECPEE